MLCPISIPRDGTPFSLPTSTFSPSSPPPRITIRPANPTASSGRQPDALGNFVRAGGNCVRDRHPTAIWVNRLPGNDSVSSSYALSPTNYVVRNAVDRITVFYPVEDTLCVIATDADAPTQDGLSLSFFFFSSERVKIPVGVKHRGANILQYNPPRATLSRHCETIASSLVRDREEREGE